MSFITCLILSPLPPTGFTCASQWPMRAQGAFVARGSHLLVAARRCVEKKKQHVFIFQLFSWRNCALCSQHPRPLVFFNENFIRLAFIRHASSRFTAPTESTRWHQTRFFSSRTPNLASVFNYKGNPSIIGIMRRKGAHKGAHNALLRSPFWGRRAFRRGCVRREKHSWGYN